MTTYIEAFLLLYFLALNGIYALLMTFSIVEIFQRKFTRLPEFDTTQLADNSTPPITILAPAYNEELSIIDSVRSFLQLEYPNLSIIVINDGSTDSTLERLKERFQLEPIKHVVRQQIPTQEIRTVYASRTAPQLLVIDKENGGKADALNVGINACRTPLVCCIDADTIVGKHAFLRMTEPYLYSKEPVVAVGGTVRLANGCKIKDGHVLETSLPKSWLARFQIVEYLRAFLFGRTGFNWMGGPLIISGAFGLFLRDAVIKAGGYSHDSVGEDMELIVRMHKHLRDLNHPCKIVHIADPVCFTEAPETLRSLASQRDRWHRGLADSLWRHRHMLFRPRYGRQGMLVYPIFLFFELLAPIVEFFGYLWLLYTWLNGSLNTTFALLFFMIALVWTTILSMQSVLLDNWSYNYYRGWKNQTILLVASVFENLGFRQLTIFFRLRGLIRFLFGHKTWGNMKRQGFEPSKQTK